MKAVAVFPATREIRLIDHDAPEISAPSQAKIRILGVGICGTDREIASFHYGTPPAGSEYLVLGHEAVGEVVETGSEVSALRPGDLVVPMVRRPCTAEECTACESGWQDFCYTGRFTERGIKESHGFLTEFAVEDQQYLVSFPSELRSVAVLIEPLTIAEKALRQVREMQDRMPWLANGGKRRRVRHALVLGAGPVGLLGAMALVLAGFETSVYSREPAGGLKAGITEAIGARYLSAADHDVSSLPDTLGSIDLVYEACGASGLAFQVLPLMDANAVFIFTGVPGRKASIEIEADRIMRNLVLKNQVVFGTVNAGAPAFDAATRDLAAFCERWPDAVEALITGRHLIEDYAQLLAGSVPGIKHVIALDGSLS